jgi:hypothetical protein
MGFILNLLKDILNHELMIFSLVNFAFYICLTLSGASHADKTVIPFNLSTSLDLKALNNEELNSGC